nr:hypothetical protein [Tanacetum cinerariifolium]
SAGSAYFASSDILYNQSLRTYESRPSLSNILHTSVTIHSNTIIRHDGIVQSFCGLLSDIGIPNIGTSSKLAKGDTSVEKRSIYDTPDHLVSKAGPIKTGKKQAAKKARKPAALSSIEGPKFPAITLVLQLANVAVTMQSCALTPLNRPLDYSQPATSSFRDQIRVFNGMFCFTSFEARIDHSINVGKGLYTFYINGQNYHRIGSLLPKEGTQLRDDEPTRDIVVNKKDSRPKRISELHPSYMALQYHLLFPYGEGGYNDKILYHTNTWKRKTNQGYVIMKEYYAYIIQYRKEQGSTLPRGGRLYQQGDTNEEGLGKRIVLPQNFTSDPRYMMQNYQDAMALCRAYGNPDQFITFTSNIKWPDISKMLAYIPGERAHDRPKVGTRVFKLKLAELLNDLTKNQVFGESRAVVYVIEFQKQSLPHAHILLWVKEHDKCKTPSGIDNIILAKLPSPTDDPEGHKDVTNYMLHRPCGKGVVCNIEEKCSKHFRKAFCTETIIDHNGYPIYHRRYNKLCVKKRKFTFDNKYVVPHNHYLLLKYHAHINVEWCNRSKAIKYIFKYLNKGPDRATIFIEKNVPNGQGVAPDKVTAVLAVGDGKLSPKMKDGEDEPTWIKIPKRFLINLVKSQIKKIVAETYPNFIERQRDDAYLRERAILTPRNDDAGTINAYMFDKLEGDSVTYNSADEIRKASIVTLYQ